MAESLFRYNLSRPYPFRWFTPSAIVGFVLFGTLFSLLNFAANGYILAVHYTNNPNATLTRDSFITKWPLNAMGKVKGSCEARDILVGSDFFTNKLSLPYRLDSIVRPATGSHDHIDDVVPSLSYLNNTLEDCSVYNLLIELLAEDRTAAQFGYAQWGPKVFASATCFVKTESGRMMLNLSTEYDLIPPTIENGQQTTLLQRDAKNRASLWWGESLISMYWLDLAGAMQEQRENGERETGKFIRKGSINLKPAPNANFSSMDFFNVHYHFIEPTEEDETVNIYTNFKNDTPITLKDMETYHDSITLQIWGKVDRYGKSFYSTVLADLGQGKAPNILLPDSTDLLKEYTAGFTNFTTDLNAVMGPANSSYADSSSRTDLGPLEISQSTIQSQYLCQIPRQKPWSELIVAIIVADLVFLRLLWTLFNIFATWWAEKCDRNAMYCEGEVRRSRGALDEEMGVLSDDSVAVKVKVWKGERGGGGRTGLLADDRADEARE